MPRISWDDLNSGAQQAGGFIGDAVKQAHNGICDLYSKYPGWMTGQAVINTPGNAMARGMLDSLCGGKALPPAPSRPFEGGQCEVNYNIQGFVTFKEDNRQVPFGTIQRGKIGGFGIMQPSNSPPGSLAYCVVTNSGQFRIPLSAGWGNGIENPYSNGQITAIIRQDGLPDDCGSLPPSDNPATPPQGEINRNPPVNGNDGFNLNIPFIYAPIDANLTIPVDIGGITFNFDLGGVTFNVERKPDGSYNNKGGDGSCDCEPCNLSPVIDIANNISNSLDSIGDTVNGVDDKVTDLADDVTTNLPRKTDPYNDPSDPRNNPNRQNKRTENEQTEKSEDGIQRLIAVELFVTGKPANARVQYGDDAPNIYYCGWFQFHTKGLQHPRQPIHFEKNYFLAPVGADGFSYTLYIGFSGRHTVITSSDDST